MTRANQLRICRAVTEHPLAIKPKRKDKRGKRPIPLIPRIGPAKKFAFGHTKNLPGKDPYRKSACDCFLICIICGFFIFQFRGLNRTCKDCAQFYSSGNYVIPSPRTARTATRSHRASQFIHPFFLDVSPKRFLNLEMRPQFQLTRIHAVFLYECSGSSRL
jgi:hypothetical protein